MLAVKLESHPLAQIGVFETTFPQPLDAMTSPAWLAQMLAADAEAPLVRDESVRKQVRDLLRHGGYKPTGRGKPASEYLVRAAQENGLGAINAAVDAGNVVALHSGLPVSVVDVERLVPPLHVGLAEAGSSFVFNASGQSIDVSGLLSLHDAEGPCANAVKDAQRTKTHAGTTRTLTVIWATLELDARLQTALTWYRKLLADLGATTTPVPVRRD